MVLQIYNLTGSILSYLSGTVIVPANGNYIVPQQYHFEIATDGQVRFDCNSKIQVSDGVSKYAGKDALLFLDKIPGLKDGDGHELTSTTVGPQRGLDVNVLNIPVVSGSVDALVVGVNEFLYNEVTVAVGASTIVVSKTFTSDYKLRRARCSGENIGVFEVQFNGTPVDKERNTWTDFNRVFDYETGIIVPNGTTVTIVATNLGSVPALFSSQLLYSAK